MVLQKKPNKETECASSYVTSTSRYDPRHLGPPSQLKIVYHFKYASGTSVGGGLSLDNGEEFRGAADWCKIDFGEFLRQAITDRLAKVQAAMDEEEAGVG